MSQSSIALMIIGAMVVLFFVKKIPIWITVLISATAMACGGILEFDELFSALSSNTVLTVIGMLAIGKAIAESGLVELIASALGGALHGSERSVMVKLCVVAAIAAGLTNALVVLAAILPIVDYLCAASDGAIKRKNLYLPISVASAYGCTMTSIGASSMLHLSALLEQNPEVGRPLTFFEPATIGLPALILVIIYAGTVGYRLRSTFHFEDIVPLGTGQRDISVSDSKQGNGMDRRKVVVSTLIFAVAIGLLLFSPLPSGFVAMACAIAFILTGCAQKTLFQEISWGTVFLVVGSIAIGNGFERSGAAAVVVSVIRGAFGTLADSPFAMCVMMLVIAAVISNFMANNAALTITAPIAFALASSFGYSPVPFGLACSVGSLLSCSTPLCNSNISMSLQAGYRFKDYIVWGFPINVLTVLGSSIALYVFYFM